jgi:hypothetical protein
MWCLDVDVVYCVAYVVVISVTWHCLCHVVVVYCVAYVVYVVVIASSCGALYIVVVVHRT